MLMNEKKTAPARNLLTTPNPAKVLDVLAQVMYGGVGREVKRIERKKNRCT